MSERRLWGVPGVCVERMRACQDQDHIVRGPSSTANAFTFAGDRDGSAHVEVRQLQVRHGVLLEGQHTCQQLSTL